MGPRRVPALSVVFILIAGLALLPAAGGVHADTAATATPGWVPQFVIQPFSWPDNTRATALAPGDNGFVDHYSVRLQSVTPNAGTATNAIGDPGATYQDYVASVEITYTGFHTGHPGPDLYFEAFGQDGRMYSTLNNGCGSSVAGTRPTPDITMVPAESRVFTICWVIDSRDADALVMSVEPLFVFSGKPVWFALT